MTEKIISKVVGIKKYFESYIEISNGKWISWAWSAGEMKHTFANHQHLGGTYSHGFNQKRVSLKWSAVSQFGYLKNKQNFIRLEKTNLALLTFYLQGHLITGSTEI